MLPLLPGTEGQPTPREKVQQYSARMTRPLGTLSEWCSNHHVVFSQGNSTLPRARRTYFDGLPQLRVRDGAYADVPLYRPQVNNDPSAYELRLHWQFTNYPLDYSPRDSQSQRAQSSYQGFASSAQRQSMSARESRSSLCYRRSRFSRSSGISKRGRKLVVGRTAMADVPTATEYSRFVDWCQVEHGHMVSLWWKLDADKSMTLSKVEFLKGLSKLRYHGDTKRLWAELDRDNSNMISFIEFCPEIALDLARFKRWAELRFGSLTALFHAFDLDRSGKLTLGEFLDACMRESIPERLKDSIVALFQLLGGWDRENGLNTITRQELAPFETWVFPAYLWEEPDFAALATFHSTLCAKHHGNPLMAWRKALDRNSDMKVCYVEFRSNYLEIMHVHLHEAKHSRATMATGEAVAVFCAMDSSRSGWVSLKDWDKAAHDLMHDFVMFARSAFGKPSKCVQAWEEHHGDGVGPEAFEKGVAPLELSHSQVVLLFEGLSLEVVVCGTKQRDPKYKKAGKITKRKLSFLDHWYPDHEKIDRVAWQQMAAKRMTVITRPPSDGSEDSGGVD